MTEPYVLKRMGCVFNEWARRYAADPESFNGILDDLGNVVTDYGERAALYFERLAAEMDAASVLPQPPV